MVDLSYGGGSGVEKRCRLPRIVCQTVIIKEQVLTFWRTARVCVSVQVRMYGYFRCDCMHVLFVCKCLYTFRVCPCKSPLLLRYVVYLRVHLRRIHQSVSSLRFGVTASFLERHRTSANSPRYSATQQPFRLLGFFLNSLARLFRLAEIRCAAGQTCWLGMKAHLMQGAQLFPWRACLFSDHS